MPTHSSEPLCGSGARERGSSAVSAASGVGSGGDVNGGDWRQQKRTSLRAAPFPTVWNLWITVEAVSERSEAIHWRIERAR